MQSKSPLNGKTFYFTAHHPHYFVSDDLNTITDFVTMVHICDYGTYLPLKEKKGGEGRFVVIMDKSCVYSQVVLSLSLPLALSHFFKTRQVIAC